MVHQHRAPTGFIRPYRWHTNTERPPVSSVNVTHRFHNSHLFYSAVSGTRSSLPLYRWCTNTERPPVSSVHVTYHFHLST
eukprot:3660337-Prymnesium_polylepis.1